MSAPDLVGNVLCLDFANTVSARPEAEWDALRECEEAWRWAGAIGLAAGVAPQPVPRARRDLTMLRELRESVWVVFDSLIDQQMPPKRRLADLITAQATALRTVEWAASDRTLQPIWPLAEQLCELAAPVADSALRLLREGPLDRLGRCPACRWLFLDTSRRGGRRWCSMEVCGSRDKARRYSARHRRPS